MERRVGVSPVTVMVALLIGGALWGLVGAILAIPTAAILSVIVDELTAEGRYGQSSVQADPGRPTGARDALAATLAYALCTIALTWPLVRGLSRDLPSDFGDPLLNCWILAWDAEHLLRALGGHLAALGEYWNANIYYPHPLALAYSDHLTAQALQILPVYALTKNPLLCYNLLFLSTFVLSGLGMFLFARELTGSPAAAFLAGLAFAFAPYRFGSIPHLQVLSSAWMPFALFGFRRFFDTRRTAPLVGAAAAWIAQNLSCSYYLIFFGPVLALYVAWEMTTRRLWRDRGTLSRRFAAGAAVVLATTPFVLPYIRLRHLGFAPRSLEETEHFAADVYGYLTADPNLWLWGNLLRGSTKAEGALFPGLTILALAAAGIFFNHGHRRNRSLPCEGGVVASSRRDRRITSAKTPQPRRGPPKPAYHDFPKNTRRDKQKIEWLAS